jgi:Ca2+:H+ antiporter
MLLAASMLVAVHHGEVVAHRFREPYASLLLVALLSVVGSAKLVLPAVGRGTIAAGLPISVVGIAIASLVLLPPAIAAVRAAQRNLIETSLHLTFGSAMHASG